MKCHLGRIKINEVADTVVGDAPELGPFAQGADRGFVVLGKDTGDTEANDVGEVALTG